MPRIGTPEYYRQKYISLMMFTGFLFVICYSIILSDRGRLIADLSLIEGVVVFVIGSVLLVKEKSNKTLMVIENIFGTRVLIISIKTSI